MSDYFKDRVATLQTQLAKMQPVIDAAHNWSSERSLSDWDSAELMRALATMDGDWPGCEGCDHQCDEPCMPATVAEIHASIDRRMEKLGHEEKAEAKAETERLGAGINAAIQISKGGA